MSQSVSSKFARNAIVWATNGVAQQRCDEESEQQHDVEEVCELLPVVIWALTLTSKISTGVMSSVVPI
jgi:hypothetical protein